MLDLVSRRYPGRRPSDYLEIDDPYTALQVDFAIALKHEHEEFKYEATKMEAIQSMIRPLGIALGVKYEEKAADKDLQAKVMPQDLPVDVVIGMLTGKGTKVINHGQ